MTKGALARYEAEMVEARKQWPSGEWDNEPDRVEWTDDKTGLPCLAVRGHLGALCGYVGVPKGHPLYGLKRDAALGLDLQAHGGINYAKGCSGVICHSKPSDPRWWLGFDCGHTNDLVPSFERLMVEIDGRMSPMTEKIKSTLEPDTLDRLFGRHYCSLPSQTVRAWPSNFFMMRRLRRRAARRAAAKKPPSRGAPACEEGAAAEEKNAEVRLAAGREMGIAGCHWTGRDITTST
jgi:hypothetical protein